VNTHEEKLNALQEYFLKLYEEFSEVELGELEMVMKAMLIHYAHRCNVHILTLLEALAKSYEVTVMPHDGKSDEEIRALLMDEIARQEEHSDA
jgi:hypothetical protein